MKRRLLTLILAAILVLSLGGYAYYDYRASQPCYGFTSEEMPASVARYVCQYESMQAQIIGGGPGYTVLMLSIGDEFIGMSVHADQDDGTIGAIVYFRDAEGNVLLDRRNEMAPAAGTPA